MQFTPSVSPADEFLEIANDFTDPKEVFREAISNAFDAKAKFIKIVAVVDKSSGIDELVLSIADDGEGMTENVLESFFGLGKSTRREKDQHGNKASGAIGEKGHGTKIYFNSRRIEVVAQHGGKRISAYMDEPRKTLRRGELPTVLERRLFRKARQFLRSSEATLSCAVGGRSRKGRPTPWHRTIRIRKSKQVAPRSRSPRNARDTLER